MALSRAHRTACVPIPRTAFACTFRLETLRLQRSSCTSTHPEIYGTVADAAFRFRAGANQHVENLRVGSRAALPEIPEANPHVSIAAFSIGQADLMFREQLRPRGLPEKEPDSMSRAREARAAAAGNPVIRRPGEELPRLWDIAKAHRAAWESRRRTTE